MNQTQHEPLESCIVYVKNARGECGAVHFTHGSVGVDATMFRPEDAQAAVDAAYMKLEQVLAARRG